MFYNMFYFIPSGWMALTAGGAKAASMDSI